MVDEELVQVREGTHPTDAEEAGGWARSDPRDEPPELPRLRQPHPASLGESLKRFRKDDARRRNEIMLAEHEVGSEVVRGPALKHRRYVSPQLLEKIAKRKALLCLKPKIRHRSPDSNCVHGYIPEVRSGLVIRLDETLMAMNVVARWNPSCTEMG
jgi:hypothetical protein